MSLYIKGMDMPTSCCNCPLAKLSTTGETLFCNYTLSSVPWDDKPFDCPLVPVPEHGPLIDADAFERRCMFDAGINDMQDVIYAMRDYPHIIPADKEETE